MLKSLKNLKQYQQFWVKNLNSIVSKKNNTKSLMIGMKPKHAIKLDIVELDKSEIYLLENILLKVG